MKVFDAWRVWTDAEQPLRDRLPTEVVDHLALVYRAAADWHGDQVRPAGEPYVEHLLQALQVAVEAGGTTDRDVLSAVLLHDVAEDTSGTVGEIEDRFGRRTAELVAAVTKPEPGPGDDPAEVRDAYLRSFEQAEPDVLLVKLSDRYSNVQALDTHPRPDKQRRYYAETVRRFVPLTAGAPQFVPLFEQWQQHFSRLADDDQEETRNA
ncbi:HD domain-containing protein [Kribbella italica]|uniref:(P)ppGpp synthase/HD superfamily hydrolase n=1 Tax=Kribbella italica TaxID=1540520 RepID=A0A7W9MSS8_9ACTN|nr:(p)ppGpp synthase/HD superfamily hydrolase [Kribbella italica]